MAVDINETPVIEEDERDLLNSAFEVKKSKKNMGKEKVKKVIKNEIKLKNSKVQRSDSINVLERLYNPSKKECKCYKRHWWILYIKLNNSKNDELVPHWLHRL